MLPLYPNPILARALAVVPSYRFLRRPLQRVSQVSAAVPLSRCIQASHFLGLRRLQEGPPPSLGHHHTARVAGPRFHQATPTRTLDLPLFPGPFPVNPLSVVHRQASHHFPGHHRFLEEPRQSLGRRTVTPLSAASLRVRPVTLTLILDQ